VTSAVTRRSALRTAAGAGLALATAQGAGLPAWARPVARVGRVKGPGDRPFPRRPEGAESMPQIEHIVVVVMENQSFDNILGMLPHRVRSRRRVDGLPTRHGRVISFNRDAAGHRVFSHRATTPCQEADVPSQAWTASHVAFAGGRNSGFVKASGPVAMRFFDRPDLPFTYALAKHFPIGERYFCSVLAQTYPNLRYLFTGTSSGVIRTDNTTFSVPAANGTIFDRFDRHGVSWKVYYDSAPSPVIVPDFLAPKGRGARVVKGVRHFLQDARAGRLPQFTLLNPDYGSVSEENPQDIQFGERFVAAVASAVMHGPQWRRTALFLTYDEHGGYYDHVPPPRAIKPDKIPPLLEPGDVTASFDRYGFRVPLTVVSPWARRGYVSRIVQDHTSITRFIERKWNFGAMTFRDANAHDMTDYFDFSRPHFRTPPRMPAAPGTARGLRRCRAAGQNPPLPSPGEVGA
jgi:phospholipase C